MPEWRRRRRCRPTASRCSRRSTYRWNGDRCLRPAILLQARRWIADRLDENTGERLDQV
jgi:succinate dehydrogenase/fumarate reductase-like Fe-S protein